MTSGRRVPCRRRCVSSRQHTVTALSRTALTCSLLRRHAAFRCYFANHKIPYLVQAWRASLDNRTPTFRRNLLPSSFNRRRSSRKDVAFLQTVRIILPSDENYQLHRCEHLRASHLIFGRCQQLTSGCRRYQLPPCSGWKLSWHPSHGAAFLLIGRVVKAHGVRQRAAVLMRAVYGAQSVSSWHVGRTFRDNVAIILSLSLLNGQDS